MKKTLLLFIIITSFSHAQLSDFNDIDFTLADNIAKLNKGADLKNIGVLAYKLTHKLNTDVEKFRAIHTWVCQNIIGDYSQHTKVLRKRRRFRDDSQSYLAWNTSYKKSAYKKLFKRKRTMCTGYAYLIRELSFLANIEVKIIDGYAITPYSNIGSLDYTNHSWNSVKLNNKWYLCDATWSAGYIDENSMFVIDYNDGYFLAEPLLFSKNHYPLEKKWLLDDSLINEKFIPGPIVYGEAFKHNATPVLPQKMKVKTTKGNTVNFKIKSEDIAIEKVSLLHTFRKGEKILNIRDVTNENGFIKFKHRFKSKGFYDVHLKVEDDIIASYTINVTE